MTKGAAADDLRPHDVSFVVRMDFDVTDADALIAAARLAARAAEPDLTQAEAAAQVTSVDDALFSFSNALGLDALLEEAPGLEVRTVASEVAYGLEEIAINAEEQVRGNG